MKLSSYLDGDVGTGLDAVAAAAITAEFVDDGVPARADGVEPVAPGRKKGKEGGRKRASVRTSTRVSECECGSEWARADGVKPVKPAATV